MQKKELTKDSALVDRSGCVKLVTPIFKSEVEVAKHAQQKSRACKPATEPKTDHNTESEFDPDKLDVVCDANRPSSQSRSPFKTVDIDGGQVLIVDIPFIKTWVAFHKVSGQLWLVCEREFMLIAKHFWWTIADHKDEYGSLYWKLTLSPRQGIARDFFLFNMDALFLLAKRCVGTEEFIQMAKAIYKRFGMSPKRPRKDMKASFQHIAAFSSVIDRISSIKVGNSKSAQA